MGRQLMCSLRALALLLLVFGIQTIQPAYAQETIRESFSAGGSTTNLLVYDSLVDPVYVNTVRDSVITAIDHYDGLFDNPVSISDLEVLVTIESFSPVETSLSGSETMVQSRYDSVGDSAFVDQVGDHHFINSELCYLQVTDFSSDSDALAFEIGHEIARCFLANSFPGLNTDYASSTGWLVESIAEWLATTVNPSEAGAQLAERAGFAQIIDLLLASDTIIGNSGLLTDSHYAGVYFWLYLSTLEGDAITPPASEDDILNLLHNFSGISYDTDIFYPYLASEIENLPDQFSQFGLALATDALAGQPASSTLFDGAIPTDIPLSDEISMATDFSLRFKQFSTFIDVPAIQVSLSTLPEDSTVRVHVSGDGIIYQPVTPDEPVILCKPDDEILINSVVSRAYESDSPSAIDFEIIYEPLEEYDDCEEPEPDLSSETERGDGTSCLVGEFELVDIPSESFSQVFGDMAGAEDISIGSMTLIIDDTLNINHSAQDFNVNTDMGGMNMLVTIDIAVSGSLDLFTDDGISFTVEQLNYSIDNISAVANIDGQTMDLSELAADMVAEFGNTVFLPPARLVCTDFGLDYYVEVNGIESVWGYHEMDDTTE